MKTILGLDLGTNSIGWALINQDFASKQGKILGMGSRIIPMSQDILGNLEKEIRFTNCRTNKLQKVFEDFVKDIC
jgi:CRISPR/Cas system Type II protein with McrA/HNH and RuvC-like nuclease domain